MKNTKGITLIALIITIIVMLILVAVSISVALNTGLFKSAGDATKNWKSAQDAESKTQIEIGGKKYDSVEDYLEGKESIPEIHNWVRTGDDLTCAHCNKTYTIGQQVNYTAKGAGSSSISEEKSGIAQAKANGESWATDLGVQTIHKDDNTEWVVLGAESSNGDDGTNETLLLTTATPTTEKIRMYGYQSYNYVINEIDRMCMELYGENARGMTIEDVNKCLQYAAPTTLFISFGSNPPTFSAFHENIKVSDIDFIWKGIQENAETIEGTKKYFTPSLPEGTSDANIIKNMLLDGYFYYEFENDIPQSLRGRGIPVLPSSTTETTKNLVFGTSDYFLASRGVYASSSGLNFGIGRVHSNIAYSCADVFSSHNTFADKQSSLRAVISLRAELPEAV